MQAFPTSSWPLSCMPDILHVWLLILVPSLSGAGCCRKICSLVYQEGMFVIYQSINDNIDILVCERESDNSHILWHCPVKIMTY